MDTEKIEKIEKIDKRKVLIVVAHPDDEVFGMGGTIRPLSQKHEVRVVTFCKGTPERLEKQGKILNSLGIASINLGYEDTFLDQIPQTELNIKLSHIVESYGADIVYTHCQDIHTDHTIVSRCMNVVCRPQSKVSTLYHFPIPGNVDWNSSFKANVFVNIVEMWSTKETFIKLYNLYKFPHPLSIEMIKARDISCGAVAGMETAESFELIFSR